MIFNPIKVLKIYSHPFLNVCFPNFSAYQLEYIGFSSRKSEKTCSTIGFSWYLLAKVKRMLKVLNYDPHVYWYQYILLLTYTQCNRIWKRKIIRSTLNESWLSVNNTLLQTSHLTKCLSPFTSFNVHSKPIQYLKWTEFCGLCVCVCVLFYPWRQEILGYTA